MEYARIAINEGVGIMGDRVSIQFVNGERKSVVLFSHWEGMALVDIAQDYAIKLKEEKAGQHITPLDRLEPETVMVDFIRHLVVYLSIPNVDGNYYLGKDENDGDNGDNGHHLISLGGKNG